MTQPPYGGPPPPPDGPQYPPPDGPQYPPPDGPHYPPPDGPHYPPGQPYDQPAYPPAIDPYASPLSGQPGDPAYPPAGGYSPPGEPYGAPAGGFPAYPTSPAYQPGQPGYPPTPQPGYPTPAPSPPPKKKRGVLIGAVLAVVLILCAGGGASAWLLLRNVETGDGAAEPVTAVNDFLEAVYTDKDPGRAADLVCSEARDEAEIAKKVDEVKGYSDTYDSPRFEWEDPQVDNQNEERALVTVKLRMTTADEKTAEQELTFTVVRKTGWWVCEVS
jgi:hypothetical protein